MTIKDICNKALGILGHDRMISDYDGMTGAAYNDKTTEATRCRLFYPSARDSILSAFAWEFATKEMRLSEGTETVLPDDCVRVIDVRDPEGGSVYATRSGKTITATGDGVMRYLSNAVSVDVMPTYVIDALTYELASRLSAPMLGNPINSQDNSSLQQTFAQLAQNKLYLAKQLEIEEHSYLGAPQDAETLAKTDISNRALAILGNRRTITHFLNDPSREALRCRQLLPMAIRHVLAQYAWEFATKDTTTQNGNTLPADYIRIVAVVDDDNNPVMARISGDTLAINRPGAFTLRYISSETQVAKMPPLVQEAIVYTLAASISSSVSADEIDPKDPNARTNAAQVAQSISKHAANAIAEAVTAEKSDTMYRGTPEDECDIERTDLCNRALILLGSGITIKDFKTDTSPEAVRFRSMFPVAVRTCLATHDWDFAAVAMPMHTAYASPDGWTRIARPPEAVRIIGAFDREGHKLPMKQTRDFIEVRVSGENERFDLRYISMDIDFSVAPPTFTEAVVYKLAALMAGTVLADGKAVTAFERGAAEKISKAIAEDTDETADHGEWVNPFLAARGIAPDRERRCRW